MGSVSGMARLALLATGVRLPYMSFEEAAAIAWFQRGRMMHKFEIIAALTDPQSQNKGSLIKAYDEFMFPEDQQNKIDYLKKSKDTLERLKDMKLYAHVEPGAG